MSYWDRTGEPMTQEEWLSLVGDDNYKRVELTTFADGTFVSTVWLGLDHRFGKGSPLIFETMVFGSWVGDDEFQWRYTSENRARAGHRAVVTTIEAGGGPDALKALEL